MTFVRDLMIIGGLLVFASGAKSSQLKEYRDHWSHEVRGKGVLVVDCLCAGVNGEKEFTVYNQTFSHSKANEECQSLYHGGLLAKIRNDQDFLLAKNISNTTNGKKYWIGLRHFRGWKWTDGSSPIHLRLAYKIKNFNAIINQHNRLFCCMLTEDDKLECTNCTEEHGYICEGYPVNTPLIDLTFALSATSPSSNNTFAFMKSTICAIIDQYGINSIFVFGSDAKIKLSFVNMQNKDTVTSHVDKIEKASGTPLLVKALDQVKLGFQQFSKGSTASRALVVMLDDRMVLNKDGLNKVLTDLDNERVFIVGVGVGNLVNETDLTAITKDEAHILRVGLNKSANVLGGEIMDVIQSYLKKEVLPSSVEELLPSTGQTRATPTTSLASEVTVTTSTNIGKTDTSTIIASKTSRMSKDLSASVSPTETGDNQEKMVEKYLDKLNQLNLSDENSLQAAVNETEKLLTVFQKIASKERSGVEVNLLLAAQHLELLASQYAEKHMLKIGSYHSTTIPTKEHLVMEVQTIKAGHKKEVTFPSEEFQGQPSSDNNLLRERFILPPKLFEKQETVVLGIAYQDLHKLLPDECQYLLDGKKMINTKLQTPIIACSLLPAPTPVLAQNITISFTLRKFIKPEDKPYCVFWDFAIRSQVNGSWSSKGCSLINRTDTKVVCSCNHLTNFAILMQLGEAKIPLKHQLALQVSTFVGCGLSLMGEVFTILAYLVFMNLKQEHIQIRFNLVVAIAVAQILFLAGIDATSKQEACIFVAVSIHYFYLAGFSWMLMEGAYLYLMVVKVYNAVVRMKLLYVFSWGFPFLMVISSIVIASGSAEGISGYVHGDFCWVSFSNSLVWTFAAPVLVVCLINSFILCRVVYEMTRMHSTKDTSNVKQGLKAWVVLFPLLGLTWVFGIFSITAAGVVFQYIFTIFNSLQGFFIFVIHVLRSSDVRAAYLRKKQKWDNSKNSTFPSSRSVAENSNAGLEKHDMNKMPLRKESPDPTFRRHQVSPINSDRIDTRESCITPVDAK